MTNDLYQEVILEEYAHPQNKGELKDPDVTLSEVNSSCGDQITVFLHFHNDTVQQVRWEGVGCAISIATASILSEHIKGKKISEVLSLEKKDMEEFIGVDEIAYGREKCLMLALRAFKKAVTAYSVKGK